MGRSLKIQKTNNGVPTDVAYPPFSALTDADTGSGTGLTTDQFLGVVGGPPLTSNPTTTYPEVSPQANVLLADGTNTGAGLARILRQKGAHKFLVASVANTVADGSFIAGQAYMIYNYGNTNWVGLGATASVAAGDVFTANGAGSGSGTGNAWPVGQCVLQNSATPDAGYMSVGYTFNAGNVTTYASYITNKWVRDWNGMTYGNYSNTNLGENIYADEDYYITNFFSNTGTVTMSGADVINSAPANNGSIYIAQIDNITS
jgi:hypothetical protein